MIPDTIPKDLYAKKSEIYIEPRTMKVTIDMESLIERTLVSEISNQIDNELITMMYHTINTVINEDLVPKKIFKI